MGKRHLKHPEARLAEISLDAAASPLPTIDSKWVIKVKQYDPSSGATYWGRRYGGKSREEALERARTLVHQAGVENVWIEWVNP
jgi:hypothetical protein